MRDSYRQAYGLIPLLNMLEANGIDVADFLSSVDIPGFGITDPAYTISMETEAQIHATALSLLDGPSVGLKLAQFTRLNNFSVYGLAIRSCASLREVLEFSLRYRNLAWGNCDIHQKQQGDSFVTTFLSGNQQLDYFLAQRDMACAALLMGEAFGAPVPLLEVHFAFPEPDDKALYRSIFRCPVKFDQDSHSIRMHTDTYNLPLPDADPLARSFYEAQCAVMSKALRKPFSYRETTRDRLYRTTPIPSLEQMAATLNMTPRTLQRRLKDENTLFSELLLEIRQQRAQECLAESELPIERIAEALGFLDAVAFSHAFKKWNGMSPSSWRHSLLR